MVATDVRKQVGEVRPPSEIRLAVETTGVRQDFYVKVDQLHLDFPSFEASIKANGVPDDPDPNGAP
jgi:hypothetical protein